MRKDQFDIDQSCVIDCIYSFFTLLGILLVVLKLLNMITWSWWIILLPLFLPFISLILVYIISATISFWKNR